MSVVRDAIRHPGLPAVMVDLRRPSRAIEARPTNPAARISDFGGVKQSWRQTNRHGVPCFPDQFDDVSRRTVDVRTPDATSGRYHHKRLLAYAPPPVGLFALPTLQLKWDERNHSLYEHLIEEKMEDGVWLIRNKTNRVIEFSDDAYLPIPRPYQIEGLNFQELNVAEGSELTLSQVEAIRVQVDTFSTDNPVLIAKDSLFNELSVGKGIAKLECCTILGESTLNGVDAINCLFNQMKYIDGVMITGSVSYSRIPETLSDHFQDTTQIKRCTTVSLTTPPSLFANTIDYTSEDGVLSRVQNGAGVLRPDCDPSIYTGASDGGEIGYFHRGRRQRPVYIKKDFTTIDTAFSLPETGGYPLKDVILLGHLKLVSGALKLERSAVMILTIESKLAHDVNNTVVANVDAQDCLFNELNVEDGLARLEYCTVMHHVYCLYLQASDCVFAGVIDKVKKPAQDSASQVFMNCIRYSAIPTNYEDEVAIALRLNDDDDANLLGSNTMEKPTFAHFKFCQNNEDEHWTTAFGQPGYGVLAATTPDAIRFGAEDGGEMGSYHHKYYSLKAEAVLDKLREFLPVGIEPVLIQDARLLHVPPEEDHLYN